MRAQLAATLLGLWLYASPSVLSLSEPARTHSFIVGPIVLSFAFVAAWEVTRQIRRVNILIGLWMLVAPWVLGFDGLATVHSMVAGALLAGLSMIRGTRTQSFGGGWASLVGLARGEDPAAEPE